MPSSIAQFVDDAQKNYGRNAPLRYAPDFVETIGGLKPAALKLERDYVALPKGFINEQLKDETTKWGRRGLETVAPLEARATRIRAQSASIAAEALGAIAPARPTDPADRLTYELRQREIRDSMRGLDPLERLAIYNTTTDPEVLEAIETAPPVVTAGDSDRLPRLQSFVDPARVAAVRLERVRAKAPEAVAQIEDLNALAEMFEATVNGVKQIVFERVPALRPAVFKDPASGQALAAAKTA